MRRNAKGEKKGDNWNSANRMNRDERLPAVKGGLTRPQSHWAPLEGAEEASRDEEMEKSRQEPWGF